MSRKDLRTVLLSVLVTLGILAILAPTRTWDAAYEAIPSNSEGLNLGDDRIRETKIDVRERVEVEHHFGASSGSPNTGRQLEGSGRVFVDSDCVGTVGALAKSDATGSNALDEGRVCYDIDGPDNLAGNNDDFKCYVYESGAWQECSASGGAALSDNLVLNNSFERDDPSSTSVPTLWTEVSAPASYSYTDTDVSEGVGLEVNITADSSQADGISQTFSGLKINTPYFVVARVHTVTGTVHMNVAGCSVSLDITNTTTGSYETLSATCTTDGVPTNIVLAFLADVDATADAFAIDHVAFMELITPDNVPTPSSLVAYDENVTLTSADNLATTPGGAPNPVASASVTVPGPGYQIIVQAEGNFIPGVGGDTVAGQINENIDGGGEVQVSASQRFNSQFFFQGFSMSYALENPTPGSTYEYTFDMWAGDGNSFFSGRDGSIYPAIDCCGGQRLLVQLIKVD